MSRHQKHMADMGMERRPNKYESKYEILREITKRPSDNGTFAVYDRSDCICGGRRKWEGIYLYGNAIRREPGNL